MQNRLLNFLLAFIITILVFNLFFTDKKSEEVKKQWIFLKFQKNDYTIPNSPVLELENNTDNNITFNTCKNLEIFKDSIKIENNIPEAFCKEENVAANTKYLFKFDSLSKLFFISWNYSFNLNINNQKYIASYTQHEKWIFNNFFSNVFYAPVYNFFVFLIQLLPNHSLWLVIIIITLIIRIILLMPQHHILLNSKKMNELQPKIKEIQEKFKWDQAKIWMELLELYKKEWVNPLWSCLPLLIQFPLLIVLYWVISEISHIANYYYLYSPLKDFNISQINTDFIWLDLMVAWWIAWWILAITIWLSQWLQIKLSLAKQEKNKEKWSLVKKESNPDNPMSDFMPDPNMMNKFMLWWMPWMLTVTAYFMPTWVWIYWLISTVFTIFQQMVVNKILEKNKIIKTIK